MNAEQNELRCGGCGVILQTERADAPGYAPPASLNRDFPVCKRCYRIRHYNEIAPAPIHGDDFLRLLHGVGRADALVVNLVDLFDFEGSWLSGIQRFIGNNPVIVLANKIDLLPKSVHPTKIEHWVRRRVKSFGLQPADVIVSSAKKNAGFDELIAALDAHRRGKDVYIVGSANVGKSTLINRMLRNYSDMEEQLTTSRYPGTTLDLVRIPLDDGGALYDTPGIIRGERLSEIADPRDLPAIVPDKEVKPRTYQLDEGQTLFFGGFARFDFVRGEHQSFTCYLANELPIHRTKLEKADALSAAHRGELLAPPPKSRLDALPAWEKQTLHIRAGEPMDVFLAGLGWVAMQGKAAHIDLYVPRGVFAGVRPSLI